MPGAACGPHSHLQGRVGSACTRRGDGALEDVEGLILLPPLTVWTKEPGQLGCRPRVSYPPMEGAEVTCPGEAGWQGA